MAIKQQGKPAAKKQLPRSSPKKQAPKRQKF